MDKNLSKAEVTKQNFIDAFWKCYHNKPFIKVTVKDICENAGYNRCTFYQYFDNVEDILEYAEQEVMSKIEEIIQKAICGNASERALEYALLCCIEQCGLPLKILLGPGGDTHFYNKFKAALHPLAYVIISSDTPDSNIDLLCELVSSDLIVAITCLYRNPKERRQIIRSLHAYIRGGAPALINC